MVRRGMGDLEESTRHAFSTRAIHAGQDPDPATGAVVTPISLSTTFAQEGVGGHQGFEYARSGNPTRIGARGPGRLARGGPPRSRVRQRAGRRGQHPAPAAPGPADPARQRRLRRHVPADRQGVGPARLPVVGRRPHRSRRTARRTGPTTSDWCGSRRRPTRCSRASTSRRSPRSPTHRGALVVVDNTFATPYLQQPLDARRRHRRALGHEVPRRPQRRGRRVRRRRRRRTRRPPAVHPERRRRGARRRSTATSCCAASRRSPSAWTATARTPARSSTCSSVTPPSTGCCTRSSPTTRATRRPPSRCATSAGWCRSPSRRARQRR